MAVPRKPKVLLARRDDSSFQWQTEALAKSSLDKKKARAHVSPDFWKKTGLSGTLSRVKTTVNTTILLIIVYSLFKKGTGVLTRGQVFC